MKNRHIVFALITGLLLRNVLPFADLFLIALVILLLVFQENISEISIIAVLTTFVYSIFFDSPIGLLPLILAVLLLLFTVLYQNVTSKGIAPLVIWIFFIASFILLETGIRLLLSTGSILMPNSIYTSIIGSGIIVTLSIFIISFKKKL